MADDVSRGVSAHGTTAPKGMAGKHQRGKGQRQAKETRPKNIRRKKEKVFLGFGRLVLSWPPGGAKVLRGSRLNHLASHPTHTSPGGLRDVLPLCYYVMPFVVSCTCTTDHCPRPHRAIISHRGFATLSIISFIRRLAIQFRRLPHLCEVVENHEGEALSVWRFFAVLVAVCDAETFCFFGNNLFIFFLEKRNNQEVSRGWVTVIILHDQMALYGIQEPGIQQSPTRAKRRVHMQFLPRKPLAQSAFRDRRDRRGSWLRGGV